MKASKILRLAIGALVLAAALLLVIGMPVGFLTSALAERVEQQTGYRLSIGGSTRLGLWPSLNVTMRDVTLEANGDREAGNRVNIGSLQADLAFSSLWSGHPEITELVINRPEVRIPLRRERQAVAPSSQPAAPANSGLTLPKIQRFTVTDGTVTFFNTRDHIENRIAGIAARATLDADRHLDLDGKAQAGGHPLTFTVKASMPGPTLERQTVPVELSLDAPGLLQAPLSGEAQLRINGTTVMFNSLSGKIGDAPFDGWASVDVASKPLVKLDLNFRRLDIVTAASQAAPQGGQAAWSDAKIELAGFNYVDAQVRLSTSELNIGAAHFAPVVLEASLGNGLLKGAVANVGAYGGQASGSFEIDVSPDRPTYAIRGDLAGVRALPLLSAAADFDRLDGKLQARIDVRSSGQSQQAITSNLQGNVTANFTDGAIRGLNVAQMIRALTSGTLSGWQASEEKTTDLTQLSASFRLDKGQATTTDLNLIGPLVKMTGGGAIDVGAKTLSLRVEPKLVMTTEGQGRASDPVGLGIPVVIDGPWASPRIYPDVAGILDNPDAAYARLKELGAGLFAPGNSPDGNAPGGNNQSDSLGRLGEALGNLIQQGLSGSQNRNPPPNGQGPDHPAQPDQSRRQMNDIMKQLFGR